MQYVNYYDLAFFAYRKYWFFLDAVQGRNDLDAEKLFYAYRNAWQNDGWYGDEAVAASWSVKNKEAFIAFGNSTVNAGDPSRIPVHYTATDLFNW